jgi:hypothetical protein
MLFPVRIAEVILLPTFIKCSKEYFLKENTLTRQLTYRPIAKYQNGICFMFNHLKDEAFYIIFESSVPIPQNSHAPPLQKPIG